MIDRKQLIERLMIVIQKTRSNTEEVLFDLPAGEEIAHNLFPGLFSEPGDLNILSSIINLSKKEIVTGQDIYNILLVCEKVPAIAIMYYMFYDEKLPKPSISMIVEDFNVPN